jgi:SET domain-containing protein
MANTPNSTMAVNVRSSRIDGAGVFALSSIQRGHRLGDLWGEVISASEGERRARRRRRIQMVELDEALAVDVSRSKSPFRYINHSCEPNARMRIGDGWIRFYARRAIRSGEELTIDYGLSYHDGQLRCQCGAARCRGVL